GTLALGRRQKALGRSVGADHQRQLALTREDLGAGRSQRLRPRRAGRVRGVHLRALPTERLREGGPGDLAWITVANGRRAAHELHCAPVHAGVRQRSARRNHAIVDEAAPPLAPGVHADAQNRDLFAHGAGFHFHVRCRSVGVSESVSITSSMGMPTSSADTSTPCTTGPRTIIFSRSSSTAAIAKGTYGSDATYGSGGW